MEQFFTGKSVEEALESAAQAFGVKSAEIKFEVVEEAKKGLFGKVKSEAKIKVDYTPSKAAVAENYIKAILKQMGVSCTVTTTETEDGAVINIDGEGIGSIIGRRGDTLDALQYLASMVCNKNDKDYFRVTVDSCGYREKRKQTLEELARKIAVSVKKTGRTTALEPMNPYERRIIHSIISETEGVSSKSIGEEPFRKVVISSDNPRTFNKRPNSDRDRRGNGDRRNGDFKRGSNNGRRNGPPPRSLDLKTSFEKDYKKPVPKPKPEDEMDSTLYGKIIID